jgi:hypothetical protein
LTRAYRPLAVVAPSIRYVGIIQPATMRTFSTTWIRYNNDNKVHNTAIQPQNTNNKEQEAAATQAVAPATPISRIGKFIQQSKDLIKFYKDGLKLLWANNKQAKALQLKVKNEGYLLNRSEFQLVHRSKKDMLKLIPFGFVFAILPESVKYLLIDCYAQLHIEINYLYIDSFACHLCSWYGSWNLS